jgi:hypothetical protein
LSIHHTHTCIVCVHVSNPRCSMLPPTLFFPPQTNTNKQKTHQQVRPPYVNLLRTVALRITAGTAPLFLDHRKVTSMAFCGWFVYFFLFLPCLPSLASCIYVCMDSNAYVSVRTYMCSETLDAPPLSPPLHLPIPTSHLTKPKPHYPIHHHHHHHHHRQQGASRTAPSSAAPSNFWPTPTTASCGRRRARCAWGCTEVCICVYRVLAIGPVGD